MTPALQKLLSLPRDLGHPVPDGGRILDLGCGNGERVRILREHGFASFGCDIAFKDGPHTEELAADGILRKIELTPYRLPFDDASLDFVFSEQVLEHVQNYDETLAELRRVLRPGGISLHIFPARLRPIEGHVFVPFASICRSPAWLRLWAMLGVRKPSQRQAPAAAVARENAEYLNRYTNYLTRRQITEHVERHFEHFGFEELAALRYTRLAPAAPVLRRVPYFGRLLSTFQTRVLFLRRSATVTGNGTRSAA